MTTYIPDHNLTDTEADSRDLRDLALEEQRAAEWDALTAPDGDVSEVIELLSMEGCAEVAALLRAVHQNDSLMMPTIALGRRLHSIADGIIEQRLERAE